MQPTTQKRSSDSTISIFFLFGGLVVFIGIVILTGVLTFSRVRDAVAAGEFLPALSPEFNHNATQIPAAPGLQPQADVTQSVALAPVPKPWDGAQRVTILLVGLDYRDWERNEGPPRSDTMILMTLDPLTGEAGMLNIPRDLWVNIPGFDYGKINTAYALGEAFEYPEGGPGLARDTVEAFLGVNIDFYAQIDFSAFERFIDEIGGIEIDVPAEIKVDPIGPHNTVVLEPGVQTLDGPVALAYARARYTDYGDFDRGDRQQQVILAIRNRILSKDLLPTLFTRGPVLYNELASGVRTDMTLDQAFSLAWLAKDVPMEGIHRGVIGPPSQVILAKSPDGSQDVLKPVTTEIRLLRDEIFASSVPRSDIADNSSLEEVIQLENPNIMIYNGSGAGGLAGRTSDALTSAGLAVVSTGDSSEMTFTTILVDYTGNPYTLRYLVDWMDLDRVEIRSAYDPNSQIDVLVTLGADWAAKGALP